jgi:Uma2 family endonuclease
MASRDVVLTYKDYEALPADGRRYEIHDGELSVTPAPSPSIRSSAATCSGSSTQHVRTRGIGEVLYAPIDVVLSETSIIQPDLVYLEAARLGAISRRGIEGAPTLVIEVLSPTTALIDRSTKRQLYARHGVPFYWLVDPEGRAVEALALGPDGYSVAAPGVSRSSSRRFQTCPCSLLRSGREAPPGQRGRSRHPQRSMVRRRSPTRCVHCVKAQPRGLGCRLSAPRQRP